MSKRPPDTLLAKTMLELIINEPGNLKGCDVLRNTDMNVLTYYTM